MATGCSHIHCTFEPLVRLTVDLSKLPRLPEGYDDVWALLPCELLHSMRQLFGSVGFLLSQCTFILVNGLRFS